MPASIIWTTSPLAQTGAPHIGVSDVWRLSSGPSKNAATLEAVFAQRTLPALL